jgi:DNA-binding HxlR family transcriptional regulator
MRRRQAQEPRSGCPIALSLEMLGDPWTLLIVRDLMFKGRKTFNDFLGAEEGIATNILTDRLARLEENDVIDKAQDQQDRRRFIYRLTAKGIALAPMLVELVVWAAAHERTDAPVEVVKAMRTDREGFLRQVRSDWLASRSGAAGPKRR